MKTPLRLLLATDYSGYAGSAEQYAVLLTQRENILGVLNIFNPPLEGALACFEPEDPIDFEKKHLREHIEEIFDHLDIDADDINTTYIVRDGINIAECIIEEAEIFDADLIIMGTHGAGKLGEVLLGSHTWEVMKKSNIPVLAIPEGTCFKKIERFIFVTECHEREIPAMQLLSTIASQMNAELIVLHLSDHNGKTEEDQIDPGQFLDSLSKRIHTRRLKTEILFYDHMAEGLNHYCKKNKPNWLIVSSEKLNILRKLFKSESSEHKMSFISHIPLLVIPDYGFLLNRLQ